MSKLAALLGAVLVLTSTIVHATELPADLGPVWQGFRLAVLEGDAITASLLTKFPLENDVYREPESISKSRFRRTFKDRYVVWKECFDKTPLEKDEEVQDRYVLDCMGSLYYFSKVNGQWRHTSFANVNE